MTAEKHYGCFKMSIDINATLNYLKYLRSITEKVYNQMKAKQNIQFMKYYKKKYKQINSDENRVKSQLNKTLTHKISQEI